MSKDEPQTAVQNDDELVLHILAGDTAPDAPALDVLVRHVLLTGACMWLYTVSEKKT